MKKETQADRWRKAGLVQLTTYVPSLNKSEILTQCEKLRKDYLRRVAFDKNFGDEE